VIEYLPLLRLDRRMSPTAPRAEEARDRRRSPLVLARRTTAEDRVMLLLYLATLAFAFAALRVAFEKYYSIDEFQYSHAAWLVSRGEVPYRDFFQHYMPLLYHWLSIPFFFLPDDPSVAMRALRLFGLPVVALTALCCYRINRGSDGRWAILAPLFLLSVKPFVDRGIEIRPDGMATALFFSAIAVLAAPRLAEEKRAWIAGALAGTSVLASQKALYYCLAFAAALALDLLVNRTRSRRFLLADPLRFCAGAAVVLLAFALYLALTRAWEGWIEHSFQWSLYHQRYDPGFSFQRAFSGVLAENRWLFLFAAAGLAVSLRRMVAAGARGWSDPALLLVLSLCSTFASFALTRSPYIYCLVPFFPALCTFSARGVVALSRRAVTGRLAPVLALCLAVFAGVELALAWTRLRLPDAVRNGDQHRILGQIGTLTRPGEPVFDLAGAAVNRPHVLFHYYSDWLRLLVRAKELEKEAPEAIRKEECVLFLLDKRFEWLPRALQLFLLENFQPYNGDLRLWGRRYRVPPGGGLSSSFHSIRDGRYFVWPPAALSEASLKIGDTAVTTTVFELRKGEHPLEYSGAAPGFFVLWLPADGVPYAPRPGAPARFSFL